MSQKKHLNPINRVISKVSQLLQKIKIFGFKFKIRKNVQIIHDKFKIIDKRCIVLNKRKIKLLDYYSMISKNAPKGDIVECGLGKLQSFQMLKLLNESKTIFGFDSFCGFPNPTKEDQSPRNPQKGDWNIVNYDDVKKFLEKNNHQKFTLVKGYVEETAPIWKNKITKISILHIDLDLHNGYKCVLNNFFDRVVTGGYILFDEYNSPKFPGARTAVDNFLKKKKEKIKKFQISESEFKYFIKKL
tara:strand:- start:9868 stop:10599 length:732 start_codon:yes stop_codon:yes gene_type:complete